MNPHRSAKSWALIGLVIVGMTTGVIVTRGQSACQQTLSSAAASLSQANTVYCLTGNVAGNGTVSFGAANVTLDGQGFRFTGNVTITTNNKVGGVIKNVDVGDGTLKIDGGSGSQIVDSQAGYMEVRASSNNIVRGNTVTSDGTRAFLLGDEDGNETPAVWSDNNLIENNTFIGDGNHDTRFIYFRHVRTSTFQNNTTTLTHAGFSTSGGEPIDNATLSVLYYCYGNTIASNTFTLDMDSTFESYRQFGYLGAAMLIRNSSSDNVIENNSFTSDADRGIWIQSSGGLDPQNNIIRGNTILERSSAFRLQAIRAGSQGNLIERNVIVATNGHAVETDGIQAGAKATFDHNTIVSKSGDALWGDGTDSSRQLVLRNNIIWATGGYTVRVQNVTLTSDYNDLYRSDAGNMMWFSGTPYSGLTAWKATGRDTHSVSLNPGFVNETSNDFHLTGDSPVLTADDQGGQLGAYTSTPSCTENWSCGAWGSCSTGSQSRSCTDLNNCGTTMNRPPLTQSCSCTENWLCGNWSACVGDQQTRTCSDENACGTTVSRPPLSQSCTVLDTTAPAAITDLQSH